VSDYFFDGCGKIFRDFLKNRVFELPSLRNAPKRNKKNRAKQPREGKKRRKKNHIFCDESSFVSYFPKKKLVGIKNQLILNG
jgi:hypothetical protein